jgi:hypothetical protein
MSRTKWQALLRTAQPVSAKAAIQIPIVGQVAVAAVQPPRTNGWHQSAAFLLGAAEVAFTALRDAEPDPIAEAERAAIQGGAGPYRQTIHQAEMVAGLLAGAGKPRRSAQAESQADVSVSAQPLFCFPCGVQVQDGRRRWSATRGWCCAACMRDAA